MSAGALVMILILVALALLLHAFWLANREGRAVRRMVAWLKDRRAERWSALPWPSRRLFVVAGIEALRREGAGRDPDFAARYDEIRRLRRRKGISLVLGMLPVALVLLGISRWGWTW